MAVGWGSEDSHVLELEALIQGKVEDARKRLQNSVGEVFTHCAECGEEIPSKRRKLISTRFCVDCATMLEPREHNFRRGIYSGMR